MFQIHTKNYLDFLIDDVAKNTIEKLPIISALLNILESILSMGVVIVYTHVYH